MNLDQEIILLYAEEDDQPIEGGLKGWVSNFHKFLDTLLSQIIKGDPKIKLGIQELMEIRNPTF